MIRLVQILSMTVLFCIFNTSISVATSGAPNEPQWWEVVGGIIAIPAALLGLAYSYILIKKTRLEAKKTELEIAEKEKTLKSLSATQTKTAKEFIAPIVETRQAQYLILRFVLLFVLLQLWSVITGAFSVVFSSAMIGVQQIDGMKWDSGWLILPLFLLANLPQIVTWIIIIGIGWPLFRDLNALLKVNLKAIVFPWIKK